MEGIYLRQNRSYSCHLLLLAIITIVAARSIIFLVLNKLGIVEVIAQPIHHTSNDGPYVHLLPQLAAHAQKCFQRGQMELIGKHLDDAIHDVGLSQRIAARRELFQYRRQNDFAVYFRRHVPIIELRQPDEVGTDQQAELVALPFSAFAHLLLGLPVVRCRRRHDAGRTGHVLYADPKLVHGCKVLEKEGDGIGHGTWCLRLAGRYIGKDGIVVLLLLVNFSCSALILSTLCFVLLFLVGIYRCRCSTLHDISNLFQRGRSTGELVTGTP